MRRVTRQVIALFAVLTAMYASAQLLRDDPWIIVTNPRDHLITWTPTTEQVLAARDAARAALHRAAKEKRDWQARDARDILRRWHTYRLQACGMTDKHRRVIYLNFVTPDSASDIQWKRNEILDISDGGFYFWRAKYDPSTRVIISWQANGVG